MKSENPSLTAVPICGPRETVEDQIPPVGQREFMMTKNVLLAVALVSVALWSGCATGGGGHTGGNITVKVSSAEGNQIGVTLTAQLTAVVANTGNQSVTWTLTQSSKPC